MGMDMNCPPAIFSTVANPLATYMDALQALFDAPLEALAYLSPAVRCEQDPTLSKLTSYIQDLPPRLLLHTTLPTSALRQHIQTLHHFNADPDFVVDFYLPSPVASNQTLRLPDSMWESGTSIQTVMVKSSA